MASGADEAEEGILAVPAEDGSVVLVGCEDTPGKSRGKGPNRAAGGKSPTSESDDEDLTLDLDIASELDRKAANFKREKC
jgi:hypothetical protein